jgi:hypothetical protein
MWNMRSFKAAEVRQTTNHACKGISRVMINGPPKDTLPFVPVTQLSYRWGLQFATISTGK